MNIPVGAGFACPNAPTNKAVDAFGRANPAPTMKFHPKASELTNPLVKAFLVRNAEGFVNFLLCPKLAGRNRRGRDA